MKNRIYFQDKRRFMYFLACTLGVGLILVLPPMAWSFLGPPSSGLQNNVERPLAANPIKVENANQGPSPQPESENPRYDGSGQTGLERFRYNNEGDWAGHWNSWGTVHRLYNRNISQTARLKTGDNINESGIIARSKGLIEEYSEFLKVGQDDLVLEDIKLRGGIFYCQFAQFYKGVRVYGGGVQFRFDLKGNLLLMAGDTYPGIGIDPVPSVKGNDAANIARRHMRIAEDGGRLGETSLFVLPVPFREGMEYRLAWQVPVFTGSASKGSSLIFIDSQTGRFILDYSLNRMGIKGRVGGLILPEYFNDPPQWQPFRNQKIYALNQTIPVCEYSLDIDPGWAREGAWGLGVPVPQDINIYGHAGCPDPISGVTGLNVFGYNLLGDYTNLMKTKYLTTNTIYCANKTGVVLTFWRWLGVQAEYWETDSGQRTDYDRATVEVSNDGGQTWTVIWSNGTSQIEDGIYDSFNNTWGGWNLQFFDISKWADGKDIAIRWGMGPTDGSGTFCGWNLDDIGIYESTNTLTDPNGFFDLAETGGVPANMLLCRLEGTYVDVINEDGASAICYMEGIDGDTQPPVAINWDTDKTTLNSFDEFNVFYHINLLLSYVKQIDPFYNAMDKKDPISVVVRFGDNYKNAFWSPEHKICFGEGDSRTGGYRNFAQFSDIIYHEYTHAITNSFYSFFMPPLTSIRRTTDGEQTGPVFITEFDAMHESFSDYWACTMNGDARVGDGDFWIGRNYVRNLDNEFKYPDDYGDDVYANSLILSGAMWETRELVGKEVADTLFHFARYGGATTFDDFLVDVLMQDEITYDGEHVVFIKDIFGLRGISRPPQSPGGLTAVAGDTFVELSWRQNSDIDEVKGYYVYFRTENDIVTDKEDPSVRRDASLATAYKLTGLTNGTTYVLKVSAYNEYYAESSASDYVYATPYRESSKDSSGSEYKVFCFLGALCR
ncbi:fibronectin type III domain-containing protein [bacterium]|nr:fibronectin type III domain-containing protein [bacterium]